MKNIVALLVALSLTAPAYADDVTELRTVSVSADAEVKSNPDKVSVLLGISERGKVLADVKKATDDQLNSLFAIAKDLGIEEKDMQTTYSAVQPEYRYDEPTSRQVMDGYSVTHNVTVTLRKIETLGQFTEAVLTAGIDEIQNVSYGLENEEALKESALKLAVEKAKRKADVLASAAGAKTGRVVAINESGAFIPQPRPMMMKASMMAMDASEAAPVPPSGEMVVRADVSVTYELTN